MFVFLPLGRLRVPFARPCTRASRNRGEAMLSLSDNEQLTRVGPGTPMGSMMCEYWMPALVSSELPVPDCDPVRVLLLGDRFISFRDSSGSGGMLSARCPHRGASLAAG